MIRIGFARSMEYEPLRSFNHGEAGTLTNLPLGPPDITERGRLLAEIEFLTRHAEGPCVCVVTKARASLAKLAELFRYVHFYAFCGEAAEYDPASPGYHPLTGYENVTSHEKELDKATMNRWGTTRDPEQSPLLLIGGDETPERMTVFHTLLKPNHSLLTITSLPPDFLSGRMYYPVHAAPQASVCFLDAPRHAHSRLCYPEVWAEELAYFHGVLRAGGAYDRQAETFILQDYARKILASAPAVAWMPAETVRAGLPD